MSTSFNPTVGIFLDRKVERKLEGFICASTMEIFNMATASALTDFENYPKLEIDFAALSRIDNQYEMSRIDREISIRRKPIMQELRRRFSVLQVDCSLEEDITLILAKIPSLRQIIRVAISPLLGLKDYVIYGDVEVLDFPATYVNACSDSDISIQDALGLARQRRKKLERTYARQQTVGISRNVFRWETNKLLAPIREIFRQDIANEVCRYDNISEFDLSIQLLMHLGARSLNEVWLGPGIPNLPLIHDECVRIGVWLSDYFSNLYEEINGARVYLPATEMNNLTRNPFGGREGRAEIDLSSRHYYSDGDKKIMVAKEKRSGKKIWFAPIDGSVSALYSKGFCNLHYANPGEIRAYGVFIEGVNMPFAYSSYGHVSYNYTKEMLVYMGLHPERIFESSRAWNAVWAPENTMSALFTYSQEQLRMEYGDLEGIITSINPNLGFTASAFRGIHFEVAALKPTVFSYQYDHNGTPIFMPKGRIAENLGVSTERLHEHPSYGENKMPFLPTVELLYLFDKRKRERLLSTPIYVVSDWDYLYNR